jgi:hypothetical protein
MLNAPVLTVAEFAQKVLRQPLWSHQLELAEC